MDCKIFCLNIFFFILIFWSVASWSPIEGPVPWPYPENGFRSSLGGLAERSCKLKMAAGGVADCKTRPRYIRCKVWCSDRYQGRFYCAENNNWIPSLPSCVKPSTQWSNGYGSGYDHGYGSGYDYGLSSGYDYGLSSGYDYGSGIAGHSCKLKMVAGGVADCKTRPRYIRCKVWCSRRYEGKFYCAENNNWTPSLPSCVKPSSKWSNGHGSGYDYGLSSGYTYGLSSGYDYGSGSGACSWYSSSCMLIYY